MRDKLYIFRGREFIDLKIKYPELSSWAEEWIVGRKNYWGNHYLLVEL